MKKVLITGITGQDGAYLAKLLLNEGGYQIYAGVRHVVNRKFINLEKLGINKKDIIFLDLDLCDYITIENLIKEYQFDYIYNLAAQSHVGTSFKQPIVTTQINGLAVLSFVEAIRKYSSHTRFYQASTSEMFGNIVDDNNEEIIINENTPLSPRSPYGTAKVFAHNTINQYREAYNLFLVAGILFNHESPLRGENFVTQKIVKYFKEDDYTNPLELGNTSSKRDWGHAKDYVKGMKLILENEKPKEYILATGKSYTIEQFLNMVANKVGKEILWQGNGLSRKAYCKKTGELIVKVNKNFYRPSDINVLIGDSTKAQKELGWKFSNLNALIDDMLFE